MDIDGLRDQIKLRLAQADAEHDGKATPDQQADALLNWVGLSRTPERVQTVISNPKFGRPGEFPLKTIEAATLSDFIAFLIGQLASVGDLPIVTRAFNSYVGDHDESGVWRRVDGNVVQPHEAQFDWSGLVYDASATLRADQVDHLPEGTRAFVLETEG